MKILNCIETNLLNALSSLRKSRYINIMVVLALFFGLLFPNLVLCFGFAGLDYIDSTLVKDYKRVAELEIDEKMLSQDDISKIINENTNIESMSRYSVIRETAIIKSNYSYANVRVVDLNYIEFNNINIKEGKWFNDSLDNVCIISQKQSMDNFKGKAIGQKINLAGQDFKVIAITEDVKFSDNIIITMSCAEKLKHINGLHCYVKFKSENDISSKVNMLKDYIAKHFGFSAKINTFKDKHEADIIRAISAIFTLLAVVIIVMFYSLLNTVNIVLNKVNDSRRSYGIRIALGATKKDIYLQNFFELLILLAISSLMVFGSLHIISLFVNKLVGFNIITLNFFIVLLSSIMCVIIAFIMSYVILKKAMKLNIIEILRG